MFKLYDFLLTWKKVHFRKPTELGGTNTTENRNFQKKVKKWKMKIVTALKYDFNLN